MDINDRDRLEWSLNYGLLSPGGLISTGYLPVAEVNGIPLPFDAISQGNAAAQGGGCFSGWSTVPGYTGDWSGVPDLNFAPAGASSIFDSRTNGGGFNSSSSLLTPTGWDSISAFAPDGKLLLPPHVTGFGPQDVTWSAPLIDGCPSSLVSSNTSSPQEPPMIKQGEPAGHSRRPSTVSNTGSAGPSSSSSSQIRNPLGIVDNEPPGSDNDEEDDGKHLGKKRQRHLESNRVATKKCRERSHTQQRQLEARQQQLEEQHVALRAEVVSLKDELILLRAEVLVHASCNDHEIGKYILESAESIVKKSKPENCVADPATRSQICSPSPVPKSAANLLGRRASH